jgi:hypothetical protein
MMSASAVNSTGTNLNLTQVVREYRDRYKASTDFDTQVLDRLALDRLLDNENYAGKAAAAFTKLKYIPQQTILMVTLDAARKAWLTKDIAEETKRHKDEYSKLARSARKLSVDLVFAQNHPDTSIRQVIQDLNKVANILDQAAKKMSDIPKEMLVSQKKNDEYAVEICAMKNLAMRVRAFPSPGKRTRPLNQDAVRWLVEVALNKAIPEDVAKEALRKPRNGD